MEGKHRMGRTRMTPPVYLAIHIPEFPAQARLRFRPAQTRTAVAILDGEPPLQQVASATAKALAQGVQHGMTQAELEVFPNLTLLPRSLPEEATTRAALLNLVASYTPRAETRPTTAPAFTFVLDMTGADRIFGPPRASTRQIASSIQALGLTARIAAAANLHAAVSAAPYALRKPTVIEPGHEAVALGPLPLAALGLTETQRTTFELWGLHTLADLAAIPEVDLVVRLGQDGKRLRQLALGQHPHLMVPIEPVFTLEEHLAFDAPVDLLDSLLFVLGPMLDQIILRAEAHALALATLTLRLTLDSSSDNAVPDHVRTLKPALPLTDRSILLKLLHLDLQADPPAAGVLAIHLHAEPGVRGKVQSGLFSPQLPEPARLDITLARIAALVGEDRVGRARLLDTHRPDSFVMERFVVPDRLSSPDTPPQLPALALRRFRPPISLRMHLNSTQPGSFFFEGVRYTVAEAFGPWRRSGDWWAARVWSREEWDVHAITQQGAELLCVLVHDLLGKHWLLEALYD